MRAVIWGAGGTAKEFYLRKVMSRNYDIIGIVDSNAALWGTKFYDFYIESPDKLKQYNYDIIVVCSLCYEEIIERLTKYYMISRKQIITYQEIDKVICNKIVEKYESDIDPEMVETLSEFRKGKSSILGAYNPPFTIFSEVCRDEDEWPYIIFQGKRMYYPKNYSFIKKEGKEVVPDVLYEQHENSPHVYLPEGYNMPDEAVIVDAGVCEGNFALRFIESARKIYLIEADKDWMAALKRTFAAYIDKVVFVNKFLSGRDNLTETTLDSLVHEKVDFLKMDIEGSEVDSLLGARRVLTSNNVQCAICSYHRQYDDKYIEFILKNYGYKTYSSRGYIFFAYDVNMIDTMELRRGVIYGNKE